MQLNCKVVKKVATPHIYVTPPFSKLSPLSIKIFVTPQVWGEGGGGGVSNYAVNIIPSGVSDIWKMFFP